LKKESEALANGTAAPAGSTATTPSATPKKGAGTPASRKRKPKEAADANANADGIDGDTNDEALETPSKKPKQRATKAKASPKKSAPTVDDGAVFGADAEDAEDAKEGIVKVEEGHGDEEESERQDSHETGAVGDADGA
jgi:hypothetical protein